MIGITGPEDTKTVSRSRLPGTLASLCIPLRFNLEEPFRRCLDDSLIREASGVWSAEVNERRRSKEGTARRRRGTCLPYLRGIRRSRYLTQERLSALSGVSSESIYRLEGGRRGAMPDTLGKLARALWVSPEHLIYAPPWW